MTISDVVSVEEKGQINHYFCDNFGFQPIKFEEEKTFTAENLIRVLIVEPHRAPYESEIANTLEGEQKAVEGLVDYVYNDDGTIIVVNDEGKINGMEGCRRYRNDVLVGPIFIAGDDGENLCSLTDEQLAYYQERFAEPEEISDEEIREHCGFMLAYWG